MEETKKCLKCLHINSRKKDGDWPIRCNNKKCKSPNWNRMLIKKQQSPEERFWKYVDKKNENDCWPWIGAITTRGYGEMVVEKKIVGAHRLSYEIHKGKIKNGLFVCHTCDNRKCVNPKHLFLGTQKDNMQDALKKGRIFNPNKKLSTV
jgi:hypothetical protein